MADGVASLLHSVRKRASSARQAYVHGQERHFRVLVVVQVAYFMLLFGALIATRNWPTPDQIGIALFVFALITAKPLRFLRDWLPFVFLILSYEALRGISQDLASSAHIDFPIEADRAMFGTLPTLWLQERLWDPGHLRWYDYVSAFMHPLHFIMPLAMAFVLWTRSRKLYWRFVGSYLLLTYAGLVTYILYPMAPPWYAADLGRIPHVETILGEVLWQHSASHPIVFIYDHFNPNPVAAMPSLHAAFPVLLALVCIRLRPRYGWLMCAYPLVMNFAIVYMGEHYVIDVIAGAAYGAIAYAAVWELPRLVARNVARRAIARAAPEPRPLRERPPSPDPFLAARTRSRRAPARAMATLRLGRSPAEPDAEG